MPGNINRNILIGLLGFLGIGAIAGGILLIVSPNGTLLGLPLTALGTSPFPDFLIPGVLLVLLLGVLPWLVIFALVDEPENKIAERLNAFNDMHWAWTFSVYVGFILILWIQAEETFEHGVHWLHTFYILLGLLIIFAALLPRVRNLYKK